MLILSIGCSKDKEILTGGITGIISVYDENHSMPPDMSGVNVSLFNDTTFISETVTDVNGRYFFEDIQYGRYRMNLVKEGYTGQMSSSYYYHVGGYSPTLASGAVCQIPVYNLSVDSVNVFSGSRDEDEIVFYVKVNGDTKVKFYYYPIVGLCSNSPDVSVDNRVAVIRGTLRAPDVNSPVTPYIIARDFDQNFYSLGSDSIYVRLYPLSFCSDIYNPDMKLLGKPSNLARFKWQ